MTNTKQDQEVTVIFKGAVNMEVGTTLAKALEAARFLTSDTGIPSVPVNMGSVSVSAPKVGNSPLEAIKNSNAKTFPQQITALAAYITNRNGSNHFDPKEIQILLKRIGNPPQNFGRDMRHATHVLNYLTEEGPNQYILTEYGKEMVAQGFESAEGISRRRKPRIRKGKKNKEI